jgi:hypothetical protein
MGRRAAEAVARKGDQDRQLDALQVRPRARAARLDGGPAAHAASARSEKLPYSSSAVDLYGILNTITVRAAAAFASGTALHGWRVCSCAGRRHGHGGQDRAVRVQRGRARAPRAPSGQAAHSRGPAPFAQFLSFLDLLDTAQEQYARSIHARHAQQRPQRAPCALTVCSARALRSCGSITELKPKVLLAGAEEEKLGTEGSLEDQTVESLCVRISSLQFAREKLDELNETIRKCVPASPPSLCCIHIRIAPVTSLLPSSVHCARARCCMKGQLG